MTSKSPFPIPKRVGLIGCVKSKTSTPQKAKDLYISSLFQGRRSFVETTCDEWWILSAKHGLVNPEDTLEPYEFTLKNIAQTERRFWSSFLWKQIQEHINPTIGDIFEIHAGTEYRDFGLITRLRNAGCVIDIPTEGMPIGKQLQFYKNKGERNGKSF